MKSQFWCSTFRSPSIFVFGNPIIVEQYICLYKSKYYLDHLSNNCICCQFSSSLLERRLLELSSCEMLFGICTIKKRIVMNKDKTVLIKAIIVESYFPSFMIYATRMLPKCCQSITGTMLSGQLLCTLHYSKESHIWNK